MIVQENGKWGIGMFDWNFYWEMARMTLPYCLMAGFFLDALIGDPQKWPHLVRFLGKGISYFDRRFNLPDLEGRDLYLRGIWLVLCFPAFAALLSSSLLYISYRVSMPLYYFIRVILIWQCLAVRDLAHEASEVAEALRSLGLVAARKQLSRIVGRDTSQLSASDCVKATVETVAENFADGIVAPLFFLALFDLPGMIFYKTVNTLDSMVGYRNERYLFFGRASAKLDDLLNWLPARLAALILLMVSPFLGLDWREGWRIFIRDRGKHLSPNSGQTEAAVAGLMHLTLGGTHVYHGKKVTKPSIGDGNRVAEIRDIDTVVKLMLYSSLFSLIFSLLAIWYSVN